MGLGSRDGVDLGPLPGLVGYALRRAQIVVFEDFHRRFATLDLRPAEFSVLVVVAGNVGLSQRRIAAALAIRPPNLVGMVVRLAGRGLLEQRPHPRDRRALTLHLTERGYDVLDQAAVLAKQHDDAMTAGLSPRERRSLIEHLGRIANAGEAAASALCET